MGNFGTASAWSKKQLPDGRRRTQFASLGCTLVMLLGAAAASAQTTPEIPVFAYSANNGDSTVSIYKLNEGTGVLRGSSYVLAGTNPSSVLVVTPPGGIGTFLYVSNTGSDNISEFQVNTTTGSLTAVGEEGEIGAGAGPTVLSADPTQQYVYVTNGGGTTVSAFAIQSDGSLEPIGAAVQAGEGPVAITTVKETGGNFAYAVSQTDNMLTTFSIQANGALLSVAVQPVTGAQQLQAVAATPSGQFLYLADTGGGQVFAFAIAADGTLSQTDAISTPFPAGAGTSSIAIDPTSSYLFTANSTANSITSFVIGGNGSLNNPASVGLSEGAYGPDFVLVDPKGQFLYLLDAVVNLSQTFAISPPNATSPVVSLTAVSSAQARRAPASLALAAGTSAVSVAQEFLYVPNMGSNIISALTLNPQNGVPNLLTPQSSFDSVAAAPYLAVASPFGQSLLVANAGFNDAGTGITDFSVAASSGALGTPALSPLPVAPASETVDPSGRFLYAADQDNGAVYLYNIAADGTISGNFSTVAEPDDPTGVVTDPLGKYLFVESGGDGTSFVFVYIIDPVLGGLTQIEGSPFFNSYGASGGNGGNQEIVVDPSGNFVVLTNTDSASITVFQLQIGGGGVLAMVPGSPFNDGGSIGSIAFNPSGTVLYGIDLDGDDITTLPFDASNGTLGPFAQSAEIGLTPTAGIVDSTGQYYLLTGYPFADTNLPPPGSLTVYPIDPESGQIVIAGAEAVTLQQQPSSIAAVPQLTAAPPIVISPTSIPAGTVGVAYQAMFTTTGGFATVTVSASGALPNGMIFSEGELFGTPTQAGTFPLVITATDGANDMATENVTLTVNMGAPVITWENPAPITAGTALSATQLDATANIPGTFVYSPTAGTILEAGQETLSVTFTPTDYADYTTATATVTLTVNPSSGSGNLIIVINGNITLPANLITFTFPVKSVGGLAGTLNTTCASATIGCSISPCPAPLIANQSVMLTGSLFPLSNSSVRPGPTLPRLQLRGVWRVGLGCLACFLLACLMSARKQSLRWGFAAAALALGLVAGCGGGSGSASPNVVPAGQYTLNITAKLGTTTQTAQVVVSVQ